MLPRHERRRLEKIEDRLLNDDPEFARRLTDTSANRWWSLRTMPPRVMLEVATGGTAGLCLILAEGAGFALAGMLTAILITIRKCGFDLQVD
ncbi:DUF3040 domain-containing protein [Parasphingorhabdus pacifica]